MLPVTPSKQISLSSGVKTIQRNWSFIVGWWMMPMRTRTPWLPLKMCFFTNLKVQSLVLLLCEVFRMLIGHAAWQSHHHCQLGVVHLATYIYHFSHIYLSLYTLLSSLQLHIRYNMIMLHCLAQWFDWITSTGHFFATL